MMRVLASLRCQRKLVGLENLSATVKHQLAPYTIWPLQLIRSDNGSNVGVGILIRKYLFVA